MFKSTAVSLIAPSHNAQQQMSKAFVGRLLITEHNELIYADEQARHFLGLLEDESLQGQNFLSLIHATYQCEPPIVWHDWHSHSSTTIPRCLVYMPQTGFSLRLKIEILDQMHVDDNAIWAISLTATHLSATAVLSTVFC